MKQEDKNFEKFTDDMARLFYKYKNKINYVDMAFYFIKIGVSLALGLFENIEDSKNFIAQGTKAGLAEYKKILKMDDKYED